MIQVLTFICRQLVQIEIDLRWSNQSHKKVFLIEFEYVSSKCFDTYESLGNEYN